MTKRIKELAEEAGYDVVYYEPDHYNPNGVYLGEGFDFGQLSNFAELIIRECADIALKNGNIREHFNIA